MLRNINSRASIHVCDNLMETNVSCNLQTTNCMHLITWIKREALTCKTVPPLHYIHLNFGATFCVCRMVSCHFYFLLPFLFCVMISCLFSSYSILFLLYAIYTMRSHCVNFSYPFRTVCIHICIFKHINGIAATSRIRWCDKWTGQSIIM